MKKDRWILIVFVLTFILSIVFSFVSNIITANANNIVLVILLFVVTGIGIQFDIIGTACMTANEATFHSMSSRKVKGAKQAIVLIKNNTKISSICNDIIGDICGIISGGIGTVLAISIALNNVLVAVLISAFISAMTVGGKAIFKKYAVKNSDTIIFRVSRIIGIFGGNKDGK